MKSEFQLTYLYYDGSIYLFGGRSTASKILNFSRNAERFDLSTNKIEVLPRMIAAFYKKHCINIENSIYIFDYDSNLVQVFNTISLKYSLIRHQNYSGDPIEDIVKAGEKICIIFGDFIAIYDRKLQYMYSIWLDYKWGAFESYSNVGDSLIFFNPEEKLIRRVSISKHTSNPNHHSIREYRRFIYAKSMKNIWLKIDIKYKTATSMNKQGSDIQNTYELSNRKIIQKSSNLLMLLHFIDGKLCVIRKIPCSLRLKGMIQSNYYLYLFHSRSISRLNLKSMKSETISENINLEDRKHPSFVRIDTKIFIIGGGANEIAMYDIHSNLYRNTGIVINSKYAIGFSTENRLYLVYRNCYKVMNSELEIIEEGMTGRFESEISLRSNVEYYDNKIFYVNKNSGCLEYFDIIKRERGGEPVEIKSK
jgi:hypothetical protein